MLKEADSEASRGRDINFYRKKHRCFKSLATLTNTHFLYSLGGRLHCTFFCSSVTFRQACRETKCIKAPRHCLYPSSLPHCTCRCRHKSKLGGPGRPPAVHESRIQNGEHISYNWVNFSSLVTAVVITFNFRIHLHHIPYSTAR